MQIFDLAISRTAPADHWWLNGKRYTTKYHSCLLSGFAAIQKHIMRYRPNRRAIKKCD